MSTGLVPVVLSLHNPYLLIMSLLHTTNATLGCFGFTEVGLVKSVCTGRSGL